MGRASAETRTSKVSDEKGIERTVLIPTSFVTLEGDLSVPAGAQSIVLFGHHSKSSRQSEQCHQALNALRQAGLATLSFNLLTPNEEELDKFTACLRLNVTFLAKRLAAVTDRIAQNPATQHLKIGYLGVGTVAAAALIAATKRSELIGAVVSVAGRPDLARATLPLVQVPTLLIVGADDNDLLEINHEALSQLGAVEKNLEVIANVTHPFEQLGGIEEAGRLAIEWFQRYLMPQPQLNPA